jgi:branched-chain amino acid transport system substrate-binding protein
MHSSLRSTMWCLSVAASFLFCALPAFAQDPAREVLIGYVAPMDDPDASSGAGAAQMAIDEANAAPVRIGGTPVTFKLLLQNDKADPRTAEQIARYLIKTSVVAVVGHWTSSTSIAVAPIYADAGIAQLAPISWSRRFTLAPGSSHFQGVGSDDMAMAYAVGYLSERVHPRLVMVIDDKAPLGVSMADSFEKYAKAAGIETSRHSVSTQTSDFNPQLQIAKNIRPDMILFTGRGAQSAAIARNLKRMGVSSSLMMTGPVVSTDFLAKINYSDEDLYAIVPGPPADGSKIQAFRKRYIASFTREPAPFAMFAYDSVHTLIAAIKKADSLDRQSIIAGLYTVNHTGISGAMSFRPDGTLKNPTYTLHQTEKGRWAVRKLFKPPT